MQCLGCEARQCLGNASPSQRLRDCVPGTPRPAKPRGEAVPRELLAQPSATSHKAVPRERRAHARRSATGTPRPAKGREAVPGGRLAQPRATRQCLRNASPCHRPRGSASGTLRSAHRAARQCPRAPRPIKGCGAVPRERVPRQGRLGNASSSQVPRRLGNVSPSQGPRGSAPGTPTQPMAAR